MKELISNDSENKIKDHMTKLLILALIIAIISQFIPHPKVGYTLLVIGVSIAVASILTSIACPAYNGIFYFVMGTFVGFMVSFAPAMVLDSLRSDNLWIWVLVSGYGGGGFLSLRDTVIRSDGPLDTPLMTVLSLSGVFLAILVSLFIISIIVSIIISPFQIYSYGLSLLISFIIANVTVGEYLSRKVYSEDLEKIDYKPHVRGTFGSFLGGIVGMMFSFIIGHIYVQSTGLPMAIFWWGSYAGLVTGVVVGFFMGHNVEKFQFYSRKE